MLVRFNWAPGLPSNNVRLKKGRRQLPPSRSFFPITELEYHRCMQVTYRERHLTAGLTFSYFTIPLSFVCTGIGDRLGTSSENDQAL